MTKFQLTILGCNSATFAYNRHHTAQLLNIHDRQYLIDCGEGTQIQLQKYKVKIKRLNHIFISHLHGDHYLGLIGLLFSMHLSHRTEPMYIYAPNGLDEILTTHLRHANTQLNFPIHFRATNPEKSEILLDEDEVLVRSFPLDHRIPCCGFVFEENHTQRRLQIDLLPPAVQPYHLVALKNGEDVEIGGRIFRSEAVTLPPKPNKKYAYCSDTRYNEAILPYIAGANLLYHEATFGSSDEERAAQTFHSTAQQAAIIALKANVNQLVIGHYSSRYEDVTPLLAEAQSVFADTIAAEEGKVIEIQNCEAMSN
jgi:ribonuclease Z